jgi:hygromycin-B 4-O-kinase
VIQTGRFDERLYYAITPRCPGRDLSDWDTETRRRLAPDLFACLDVLYRWDSSGLPGWGLTDGHMHGLFPSWPHYLGAIYNPKFSYELSDLAGTFFEPELYAAALAAQQRDFCYLPAQKWLIHGDFGYNNVISDGSVITGVLDWAEARLGDYLYDISNLDYWADEDAIPYAELWREYVAHGGGPTQGEEEPHFRERLRCYTIGGGAHDLRLSAYRNDYEDYLLAKKKLAPYV